MSNKGCLLIFTEILKKLSTPQKHQKNEIKYNAKSHIMSKAELSFYHCLKSILTNDHAIFTKVRLEDIIEADRNAENRNSLRNRIKSRHIDFIICDSKTGSIQRAIELNDKSHNRKDRQERDEFIKKAFESAGTKLITVPCKKSYTQEDIQNIFN